MFEELMLVTSDEFYMNLFDLLREGQVNSAVKRTLPRDRFVERNSKVQPCAEVLGHLGTNKVKLTFSQ